MCKSVTRLLEDKDPTDVWSTTIFLEACKPRPSHGLDVPRGKTQAPHTRFKVHLSGRGVGLEEVQGAGGSVEDGADGFVGFPVRLLAPAAAVPSALACRAPLEVIGAQAGGGRTFHNLEAIQCKGCVVQDVLYHAELLGDCVFDEDIGPSSDLGGAKRPARTIRPYILKTKDMHACT